MLPAFSVTAVRFVEPFGLAGLAAGFAAFRVAEVFVAEAFVAEAFEVAAVTWEDGFLDAFLGVAPRAVAVVALLALLFDRATVLFALAVFWEEGADFFTA